LAVIDLDSKREMGAKPLKNSSMGPLVFNQDGTLLFGDDGSTRYAWNYGAAETTILNSKTYPCVPSQSWPGSEEVNYDRSIYAIATQADQKEPSLGLYTSSGSLKVVPTANFQGFDTFGRAWIKYGRDWQVLDRSGSVRLESKRPRYLAPDQSKVRGSRSLTKTESTMSYQGSEANVACIWLTDDRSVPYAAKKREINLSPPGSTALVFAGADIYEYGFVPNRDLVYVVSDPGVFVIPYSVKPK
jgi:hypothetical protein